VTNDDVLTRKSRIQSLHIYEDVYTDRRRLLLYDTTDDIYVRPKRIASLICHMEPNKTD